MGNSVCGGNLTEAQKKALAADRMIAKRNAQDHKQETKTIKILLLGTGESGKSTIFKQVRELYGEKFDRKELRSWVPMIHENINKQIISILNAAQRLEIPLENAELAKPFVDLKPDTVITRDLGLKMKDLWYDKGIQKVWSMRAEYQVLECIEYYMKNIDRIAENPLKYTPTFQDVVHARVRTTGIIQERFKIKRAPFEMFDVGGQRSERKKWLNCFDNVTTVIFVAAINEYDQVLFEEAGVDRIKEALRVWKDIVNRTEFSSVGFVLFLNKHDLFREKLTKFPFRVDGPKGRNQDYRGENPMREGVNVDQAIFECGEYMKLKFLNAVEARKGNAINAYFTNATDTDNMKYVFDTCEEQILRMNLANSGFGPHAL